MNPRVYSRNCHFCRNPFLFTERERAERERLGLAPRRHCPKHHSDFVRDGIPCARPLRAGPVDGIGLLRQSPYVAAVPPGPPIDDTREPLAGPVSLIINEFLRPGGRTVAVLHAPTGTGKSTFAPYRMLRSPLIDRGAICVTQPRTATLRRSQDGRADGHSPSFVAERWQNVLPDGRPAVGAGCEIGYTFRDDKISFDEWNGLLYVTDGTLLNWIVDGKLGRFSTIFIDEAHERSTNIELILGLLRVQLPLYPRLRLVIASATLELERFVDFFGGARRVLLAAPAEEWNRTRYPVTVHWYDDFRTAIDRKGRLRRDEYPSAIAAIVRNIRETPGFTSLDDPYGDILVFLPTLSNVDDTADAVRELELPNTVVLPCHAQMTTLEQADFQRAAEIAGSGKSNQQRVIIATNYAETAITIQNLRYVIDSGDIFRRRWDPGRMGFRSALERHSCQGSLQRRGRVGRTQDGECFLLYTRETFDNEMPAHTPSAVASEPMDAFLLRASIAGVPNPELFQWPSRRETPAQEIRRAMDLLRSQTLLDSQGMPVSIALEASRIQTGSLAIAIVIVWAAHLGCLPEAAAFLAVAGYGGRGRIGMPFEQNEEGLCGWYRVAINSADDLSLAIQLLKLWRESGDRATEMDRPFGLDVERMRDANARYSRTLTDLLGDSAEDRPLDAGRLDVVRYLFTRCFPGQQLSHKGPSVPAGTGIALSGDSACFLQNTPATLIGVELNFRDDFSPLLATLAVQVAPEWLAHAVPMSLWPLTQKTALLGKRTAFPDPIPVPGIAWAVGTDLSDLIAVRNTIAEAGDSGIRPWLVIDRATRAPAILSSRRSRLQPGEALRARVTGKTKSGVPVVSQQHLFDALQTGATATGTIVRALTHEEFDGINKLEIQLEGGVHGLLAWWDADASVDALFSQDSIGASISVVLSNAERGRLLSFETPIVSRNRPYTKTVAVEQRFDARVRRVVTRGGELSQLAVDLMDGVTAKVAPRAMEQLTRKRHSPWKPGDTIPGLRVFSVRDLSIQVDNRR